jgi:hypothetical protein
MPATTSGGKRTVKASDGLDMKITVNVTPPLASRASPQPILGGSGGSSTHLSSLPRVGMKVRHFWLNVALFCMHYNDNEYGILINDDILYNEADFC